MRLDKQSAQFKEYTLIKRRRPEQWWGLAWLPEFWIATVYGIGAIWSMVVDRKKLKKPSKP